MLHSVLALGGIKVGRKGRGHRDGSRVAVGETVQAELQTLPGDAQRLPDILEDKQAEQSLNPNH